MADREYLIRLPWPPAALSPNSRTDRRAATGKRKAYRDAGFYAAREIGAEISPEAHLAIKFFAPDRRKRDLDNMLASIKAGLDGIAEASGVDDSGWSLSLERSSEPVSGGAVLVHVKPADTWQHIGDVAARMTKGVAQ